MQSLFEACEENLSGELIGLLSRKQQERVESRSPHRVKGCLWTLSSQQEEAIRGHQTEE